MVQKHMFEHNFHCILIRLDFQVYSTKDISNARYLFHVSNLNKVNCIGPRNITLLLLEGARFILVDDSV